MDMIRDLLLRVEATAKPLSNFDGIEAQHIALLHDAGLVSAEFMRSDGQGIYRAIVDRLTWSGHEFLQSMRDDTLWKKAKEHVIKPGASWSFDILKEWAKHEVKQKLGLPLA